MNSLPTIAIYLICAIIVLLAVILIIREVRKLARGKCCDRCSHCPAKDSCDNNADDKKDAGQDVEN